MMLYDIYEIIVTRSYFPLLQDTWRCDICNTHAGKGHGKFISDYLVVLSIPLHNCFWRMNADLWYAYVVIHILATHSILVLCAKAIRHHYLYKLCNLNQRLLADGLKVVAWVPTQRLVDM
jgi:hypothetical protein